MKRLVVIIAATLAVAACGGTVGSGERPVQFYISTPNGTNSFGLSECSAGTVQGLLVFDGQAGRQIGDYSARAIWTSDSPGTVSVTKGQLLAHKPGTATITAKYLDFVATASVVVVPMVRTYISPTLTDLAPNVDQQYNLYGVFEDSPVPVNLTAQAVWDLNGEAARANVNAVTGLVHAGAASTGAPIQLHANLPVCGLDTQTQFQVTDLADIRLEYEFVCDANNVCTPPANLPVGTSMKVRVMGDFAGSGHTPQNLSHAVDIVNHFEPKLLLVSATDANGDNSIILQAVDLVDQAYITAGLYNYTFSAQTQPMNLVTDPLLTVTVAPKDLQIMYPDTGRIDAFGDFQSGLHIPITRHVAWSASDPNAAAIDATFNNAGRITVGNLNEDVTITGVAPDATLHPSDTADLKVFAKQ